MNSNTNNTTMNNTTMNNTNTNNTNNKYYLMICELHHPAIHGKTETSDPHIETHYLVTDRFEPKYGISYISLEDEPNEYNTDDEDNSDSDNDYETNRVVDIYDTLENLRYHYSTAANNGHNRFGNHPTIRNYYNIICRENYIKPEIGEYIILPTQEAIAILKTFWLRIIQRKWKNVFKERKYVLKCRSQLNSLRIRSITGSWPDTCNEMPGLRGMLNGLIHI